MTDVAPDNMTTAEWEAHVRQVQRDHGYRPATYAEQLAMLTPEALRSMTPEQAAEEQQKLQVAYWNSQAATTEAQSRLDKFTADPGVAKKLLAGDSATRRQFDELSAAVINSASGGDVLAETLTANPDTTALQPVNHMPPGDTRAAIGSLRDVGISDGAILEAFSGNPPGGTYNAETIATVKAYKAACLGDAAWCERLMKGGYAENRELTLWSIVLSNAGAA